MNHLKRALFAILLMAAASITAGAVWLQATSVNARDLPPLRTGDIVFQESGSSQSAAIMLASRSLYTHTGLIEIDGDGHVFVVEAVGPVKRTPLPDWIARGTGGRITVKRLQSLDEKAARAVLAAAHAYDGRPYDFYFYEGRDAIYCSELVNLAFQDGGGIKIGNQQKLRDLHIDNAAARALIESRWREHPLCRDGKADTFQNCYPRILEQTLVTPASVARDSRLETVFSNFGLAAD